MLATLALNIFAVQRDFKTDALAYLKSHGKEFPLTSQDFLGLKVADIYTDDINITHVWLQQTANNIPLYNGLIGIHLNQEGKVVYAVGDVISDLQSKVNTSISVLNMEKSVQIAAKLMTGKEWNKFKPHSPTVEGENTFISLSEGLTDEPIPVRAQYFVRDDKKVILGWEVTIESLNHSNSWTFQLDAQTGELIRKFDNVVHCSFSKKYSNIDALTINPVSDGTASGSNNRNNANTENTQTTTIESSSYNVFPYFVESPNYGVRQIINSPDNALASPYGWHDTNGVDGPESTLTIGNNVDAYVDKIQGTGSDGTDKPDFAYPRPDGGPSLTYNFPLDLTQRTDTNYNTVTKNNYKAVITQLFYTNNIIHDVMYQYGFTESARNFQKNNYGRGGKENDYVLAEGMDGGGMNNAGFQSPSDGTSPRMQMYMWDVSKVRPILIVNAPAAIKDTIGGDDDSTGYAMFGPCNFNVTGACALVNDGSSTPTWGCTTFNGSNYPGVAGKIAIVMRNSCNFYNKIFNAQSAGAIGVIVINRNDSLFGGMALPAGEDPGMITIPSLLVPLSIGNRLLANLSTLNVTLYNNDPNNCNAPLLNGSLDNGVVFHEYSHGVSNRLTGTGSSCLQNAEQGGEGWSDFFALALTQKPGDNKNTPRPIGTYVSSQPANGPGIRTYPYSFDMGINPITYADLANLDIAPAPNTDPKRKEVHEVGEIWCATLWDMYWLLTDKLGYNSNVYAGTFGTSGNATALTLVTKGMSLQPCSPGFIDARNAILKADSILYNKANTCDIWTAFARRGMGYSAKQGSVNSCLDQTAAFDMPPACNLTPTATASFTASDTTVCAGSSLTFTNTSTASSGTPDSVRWTIQGSTPATSTSTGTVTAQFNTVGTYVISLIAYKSGNASTAYTKSIRVKPIPTVGVNSPNICAGQTATLTGTGASSYTWSGGLTGSPSATTPNLNNSTTYTVTGTTQGCSATAVANVTVTANPIVGVNSPTICAGQTATLTGTGASSYTWSGGLTGSPSATTPNLNSTTTYTVTGTTGNCFATAVATVTVTALPNVTVNAPSICAGQTATLQASGANSYTWSDGLPSISNPTTPTLTATKTYSVTGTVGLCSKTVTATVTVNTSAPTVTISSNPVNGSVCQGASITLTGNGADNYSWSSSQTGTTTGNTLTFTPTGNVTVNISGTLTGCVTAGTNAINVTVNTPPTVGVNSPNICAGQTATLTGTGANNYTWSGGLTGSPSATTPPLTTTTNYTVTGSTNGCTNTAVATVTVTDLPVTPTITQSNDTLNSSTIIVGATYEWYNGTTLVGTTSTPYYKITSGGIYTVKVKNGLCSSTSGSFTAIYTGVKNSSNAIKDFELYPNPTDGKMQLNLNLNKTASVQIKIYSAEGRELYGKTYGNIRNINEEMNIHDLAKGVYILRLNIDDEVIYHKIVKQ